MFKIRLSGLSSSEASRGLKEYGKNEIIQKKKVSPVKMFISQFTSPIILLLIAAAILSLIVNAYKGGGFFDSELILIIVFISGIAGFIQDFKAEKAVEELQKMATPTAKVVRDGKEQEIPAVEIVPGDLIVVESGDVIPADAKIISGNVELDESVLTGESKSVKKGVNEKIFSHCSVYSGSVVAKVYATGMNTEMGKIAAKMQEIKEEPTAFEQQMSRFTKKLVYLTILIIIVTLIVGMPKFGVLEASLIAVSLAVAAIPEDLPAVITIALSLGARAMVKGKALVRKLAVTESIGSVDIICTDKTGTLTIGNMQVRKLWLVKESKPARDLAIKCCHYCNNAKQIFSNNKEKWIGDETDIALKQFSTSLIRKEEGKRLNEIPFTSERKMESVVYKIKNNKIVFSKGAPEVLIQKCDSVLIADKTKRLTPAMKKKILSKNKEFASKGYRILSLAYKDYKKGKIEEKFTFIGLVALADPVRPEVKEAVEECYSAGIRIIMITGDNPLTARSVAREVNIGSKGVLTGQELDKLSDDELKKKLSDGINVFARTTPFHKLRIMKILQNEGHIVSMTGDGVNDSLALKKADVGVAMGIRGTEIAKQASDIILLDDNFATIKNAIKEGRRIFDNIRKFVDYLLTCNVAEVLVVFLATVFLPFISLYPIQILWINLITDGLPALALSVDPARPDIMKRKPKKKTEGIINKKLALLIGGIGIKKSLIILGTFLVVWWHSGIAMARTALFTAFILYEFVRIAVIRYDEKLNSLKDWLANKVLVYSLLTSLILQLLIIYTPMAKYFKVTPLGLWEWVVLLIGTSLGMWLGIVIAKWVDKVTKGEDYL